MCKAPVPGQVKTRLFTAYTQEEAVEIHRAMATTVIQRVARMFPHAWLAVDDMLHPFFRSFALKVVAQGEGDLGERMTRLLSMAFRENMAGLLFLGTDSPHMPESRIDQAVLALSEAEVVLGPVEDGGYDLIALSGPFRAVFCDIDWGTDRVASQTVERATQSGLKTRLLETGFDVDVSGDMLRARRAGWSEAKRWL